MCLPVSPRPHEAENMRPRAFGKGFADAEAFALCHVCRLPSARCLADRFGRPSAGPQGSRRRANSERKMESAPAPHGELGASRAMVRTRASRAVGPSAGDRSRSGLRWNLRKRHPQRGKSAVFRTRVKEIPRPEIFAYFKTLGTTQRSPTWKSCPRFREPAGSPRCLQKRPPRRRDALRCLCGVAQSRGGRARASSSCAASSLASAFKTQCIAAPPCNTMRRPNTLRCAPAGTPGRSATSLIASLRAPCSKTRPSSGPTTKVERNLPSDHRKNCGEHGDRKAAYGGESSAP